MMAFPQATSTKPRAAAILLLPMLAALVLSGFVGSGRVRRRTMLTLK